MVFRFGSKRIIEDKYGSMGSDSYSYQKKEETHEGRQSGEAAKSGKKKEKEKESESESNEADDYHKKRSAKKGNTKEPEEEKADSKPKEASQVPKELFDFFETDNNPQTEAKPAQSNPAQNDWAHFDLSATNPSPQKAAPQPCN
jgi:hypothetical protein